MPFVVRYLLKTLRLTPMQPLSRRTYNRIRSLGLLYLAVWLLTGVFVNGWVTGWLRWATNVVLGLFLPTLDMLDSYDTYLTKAQKRRIQNTGT